MTLPSGPLNGYLSVTVVFTIPGGICGENITRALKVVSWVTGADVSMFMRVDVLETHIVGACEWNQFGFEGLVVGVEKS